MPGLLVLSSRPGFLHGLGMTESPEPSCVILWWVGKNSFFLELIKAWLLFARVAKGTLPPVSLSPSQIVNGYFVHFFAPQGLPVVPKNVVFVIDVSGSMHGRKMEQVLSSLQVGVR